MPEAGREALAGLTVALLEACRRWNVPPLDPATVRAYAGELLPRYTVREVEQAIRVHEHDVRGGHRMPSCVDLVRILRSSSRPERQPFAALPAPELDRVTAEQREALKAECLPRRLLARVNS